MKNICLNGLNNFAPTELNILCVPSFYDDFAPTEQKYVLENQYRPIGLSALRVDGRRNRNHRKFR